MSLNIAMMLGEIVDGPHVYQSQNGHVISFVLAVDEADWEGKPKTNYFDIVKYQKTDRVFYNSGDKIFVEGSLMTSSYEDKNGVKQWRTKVKASKLEKIDR